MKLVLAALLAVSALPAFANQASTDAVIPVPVAGRFSCAAQNDRGQVFREIGVVPADTQARAIASCRASSLQCHPIGCNRI